MSTKNLCLVIAGAMVVLSARGALAQLQTPGISLGGGPPRLSVEEQEKRKAVDDAYRSAIDKLPDKKKSTDPWAGTRSPATGSLKQR